MPESGKGRELKGRVKEAAGAIRDDDEQRREGKRDQARGNLERAGEKAGEAVEDVKDALKKR